MIVDSPTLGELISSNSENELFALWRENDESKRAWGVDDYRRLGVYFRARDPLLAYEVFSEGLSKHPHSPVIQYHQAHTLARLGSIDRAMEMALRIQSEHIADEQLLTDVFSFLARLHKDRGLASSPDEHSLNELKLAFAGYQTAYDTAAAGLKSYPAINAATLALVTGMPELARRFAVEATVHATTELANSPADDYWRVATLAEAALILEDVDEAARLYKRAASLAGTRYDDIASMRRNARMVAKHHGRNGRWIEDILRIPAVVVFTGHMIDRPGRPAARFPARLEPAIAAAIENRLDELNAGFGFAGAACGSDILFLEAMRQRGQTHIVLPFGIDGFRSQSVDFPSRGNWSVRFDRVLKDAAEVQAASGAPSDWGGIVFEYANLILLGLAVLKSRALDTDLIGLAVWDGKAAGDGPGGTASTVSTWMKRKIRVETIRPSQYMRKRPLELK
jgi:tetratricopeptide (TPR) repeat protein